MDTGFEDDQSAQSLTTFYKSTSGSNIISQSKKVGLDPSNLYEAVIDLSKEGLITANCINIAAGILLQDLGLPNYFFENISKDSLRRILGSIASNITFSGGKAVLNNRIAHVDFELEQGTKRELVRIATGETRDYMEAMLEQGISGHRREYYFNPSSNCYTYIIRPETVHDFPVASFEESRFLFHLAGDYTITPKPARGRYEKFLKECDNSLCLSAAN